jgi:hypothetical protein
MLVVGPLFQITVFLVQFLELPFPIFALSVGLGGIFRVGIVYILTRMHLRMASSRLFKRGTEYKMSIIHAAYGNVILQYVTLTD